MSYNFELPALNTILGYHDDDVIYFKDIVFGRDFFYTLDNTIFPYNIFGLNKICNLFNNQKIYIQDKFVYKLLIIYFDKYIWPQFQKFNLKISRYFSLEMFLTDLMGKKHPIWNSHQWLQNFYEMLGNNKFKNIKFEL